MSSVAKPARAYHEADAGLALEYVLMQGYWDFIERAAGEADVRPEIICGILSLESGCGLSPLLRPNGPGGTGDWIPRSPRPKVRRGNMPDDGLGFGRGLMQIDYDWHPFARTGNWRDPEQNLVYGGRVLGQAKRYLRLKFPKLTEEALLAAAIAGYNCGAGNVEKALRAGKPVDAYTTHGNYSADVLARSEWFKRRREREKRTEK